MLLKPRFLIRTRILLLGASIGAFVIAVPLLLRSEVHRIVSGYELTATQYALMDRVYETDGAIQEIRMGLARFTADPGPENKGQIEDLIKSLDDSIRSLEERPPSGAFRDRASQLRTVFDEWRSITMSAVFATRSYAPTSDALAEHALAVTSALRSVISELNQNARFELFSENQSSARNLALISALFFALALAIVASLWFTIIPHLSALLWTIQRFQVGHYEQRVRVEGRSEISEVAAAFNAMAERVQASTKLKDEFVSTVSHELRTPLTAIRGAVGLLLSGVMGKLPSDAEELLHLTEKNVDRLGRLIAGILDMAKIEAGVFKLEFEKADLASAIDQVVGYLKPIASGKQVNLIWERPQKTPITVIDRDRIEQVLINLLSNAIKFCEKNGMVKISLELFAEEQRVRVHVIDDGQGIPKESQQRIFEKFQQLETSLHKNKEGSGLGLAIAKAIIEEHQGHIGVSSEAGSGSDFWFELPWNGTELHESASSQQLKAA